MSNPKNRWQASTEKMDDRINRLKTADECGIFFKNATERGFGDLAARALRRAVELQAATHDGVSGTEKDALEAVYAHEQMLNIGKHKKVRATGAWQLVRRHGVIKAIEMMVTRKDGVADFTLLKQTGMQDLAFEAIVTRHPEVFGPDTVQLCTTRLSELDKPAQ